MGIFIYCVHSHRYAPRSLHDVLYLQKVLIWRDEFASVAFSTTSSFRCEFQELRLNFQFLFIRLCPGPSVQMKYTEVFLFFFKDRLLLCFGGWPTTRPQAAGSKSRENWKLPPTNDFEHIWMQFRVFRTFAFWTKASKTIMSSYC